MEFLPKGAMDVASLLTGKQTHKMACYLLGQCAPPANVWLVLYTFDLEEMVAALKLARKNGSNVSVTVDYKSSLGHQTREQTTRLKALRSSSIEMKLASSNLIQEEFSRVGRKAGPGRGICHIKMLVVGHWMLLGSTNWTTSAKCNQEIGERMKMNSVGLARIAERRIQLDGHSMPLTVTLLEEAEVKRSISREEAEVKKSILRARSSSPISPRRLETGRASTYGSRRTSREVNS